MKLIESHGSLTDVCRVVERRLRGVDYLRGVVLPVKLLMSFESLGAPITSRDPTAYNRSTDTILVNAATFFSFPKNRAKFALAHEIGHHVHDTGIRTSLPELNSIHSCLVADWLAARWGFKQGLRSERLESRGKEYCDRLSQLTSESEFLAWAVDWDRRFRTSRLLRKPLDPPPKRRR